jgi:hypothetical protein
MALSVSVGSITLALLSPLPTETRLIISMKGGSMQEIIRIIVEALTGKKPAVQPVYVPSK